VQDGTLDIAAMQRAAEQLVGEHDFRNFCKPDVVQVLDGGGMGGGGDGGGSRGIF